MKGSRRTIDNVAFNLLRASFQDEATGCWVWVRARNRHGYGSIYGQRGVRTTLAHRVSYETFVGPVPDGLVLDHLCRNRACINPGHLEPVTQQVNMSRAELRSYNGTKTHCESGHEFTEENTYRPPGQPRHRMCRACARARGK